MWPLNINSYHMNKIYPVLILLIILGVAGCKLGPDFVKPEYQGREAYRFDTVTTDTVINLKWWELFNDPILDTLIRIALTENKDVLIAAANIEAARANVGFTKADQWPTFNVSASVATGDIRGFQLDGWSAYPELVWEVAFWGKYRRMTEAARAELVASEYGKRTIQMSLISAVASTYFLLLAFRLRLEISNKTLASRDSGQVIIQARYDYGIVPEIDLNQAQIQTAISAAAVPTYKRNIALTEIALSILLGREPHEIPIGNELLEQVLPLDIPTGIPSQLLQRRPDVRQAEEMYRAQNARIGVAEAMRWPSISLTGFLGVASNDLMMISSAGLAWSAGASLFGPLFQFGKNKRRKEIEVYKTQASLLAYENTVLQAFKDVEDALVTIETLREELLAQEARSKAALNAEYLSGHRYDKGQTSYLEVLESQRQAFDAQLQHSRNMQELHNAHVKLYKALGGGWLSPEEEEAFLEAQRLAEEENQQ